MDFEVGHDASATPVRARPARRLAWPLALLLVAAVLIGKCTPLLEGGPQKSNHLGGVDFSGLVHRVGAYTVAPAEYHAASKFGIDIALGTATTSTDRTAAADFGINVIDKRIQQGISKLYAGGTPSDADLQQFSTWVADLVQTDQSSGRPPAAYYLLDDYVTDVRAALEVAYSAIRANSRTATVCGFTNKVRAPETGWRDIDPSLGFMRAITNYSPQWCDAVLLYSYREASPASRPNAVPGADWTMRNTLQPAIAELKSRGFDFTKNLLIGTPMAFTYDGRTSVSGRILPAPQYWIGPTAAELAAQIKAFCDAGASSIIAWPWQDIGSQPRSAVNTLATTPALQSGFTAGIDSCRQTWGSEAPFSAR